MTSFKTVIQERDIAVDIHVILRSDGEPRQGALVCFHHLRHRRRLLKVTSLDRYKGDADIRVFRLDQLTTKMCNKIKVFGVDAEYSSSSSSDSSSSSSRHDTHSPSHSCSSSSSIVEILPFDQSKSVKNMMDRERSQSSFSSPERSRSPISDLGDPILTPEFKMSQKLSDLETYGPEVMPLPGYSARMPNYSPTKKKPRLMLETEEQAAVFGSLLDALARSVGDPVEPPAAAAPQEHDPNLLQVNPAVFPYSVLMDPKSEFFVTERLPKNGLFVLLSDLPVQMLQKVVIVETFGWKLEGQNNNFDCQKSVFWRELEATILKLKNYLHELVGLPVERILLVYQLRGSAEYVFTPHALLDCSDQPDLTKLEKIASTVNFDCSKVLDGYNCTGKINFTSKINLAVISPECGPELWSAITPSLDICELALKFSLPISSYCFNELVLSESAQSNVNLKVARRFLLCLNDARKTKLICKWLNIESKNVPVCDIVYLFSCLSCKIIDFLVTSGIEKAFWYS